MNSVFNTASMFQRENICWCARINFAGDERFQHFFGVSDSSNTHRGTMVQISRLVKYLWANRHKLVRFVDGLLS